MRCCKPSSRNPRAEDCRPETLASFDMGLGAILIPVTINAQGYVFLVDTGGFVSTLSPGVASALNLPVATVDKGEEMFLADGMVLDQFVTVNALQLGAARIDAVRFLLQPQQSRVGIDHFAGTVAPDFLHHFDLDFPHNTIGVLSRERCPAKAAAWTDNAIAIPFQADSAHHIVVPVKLDGVQTKAALDTGASQTVMSALLAQHAFHLAPGKGLKPRRGQTLELNGMEFDGITIGILPDDMASAAATHHQYKLAERRPTGPVMNAVPIIIGLDQLRKIHLYVDYKNEMLYVEGSAAARSPVIYP